MEVRGRLMLTTQSCQLHARRHGRHAPTNRPGHSLASSRGGLVVLNRSSRAITIVPFDLRSYLFPVSQSDALQLSLPSALSPAAAISAANTLACRPSPVLPPHFAGAMSHKQSRWSCAAVAEVTHATTMSPTWAPLHTNIYGTRRSSSPRCQLCNANATDKHNLRLSWCV